MEGEEEDEDGEGNDDDSSDDDSEVRCDGECQGLACVSWEGGNYVRRKGGTSGAPKCNGTFPCTMNVNHCANYFSHFCLSFHLSLSLTGGRF